MKASYTTTVHPLANISPMTSTKKTSSYSSRSSECTCSCSLVYTYLTQESGRERNGQPVAKPRSQPAFPVLRVQTPQKFLAHGIAAATNTPPSHARTHFLPFDMAFPGGPGMMPAAMNPNAGMSDQEQQMVKAVRNLLLKPPWNEPVTGSRSMLRD
jgi:hypothetical protein